MVFKSIICYDFGKCKKVHILVMDFLHHLLFINLYTRRNVERGIPHCLAAAAPVIFPDCLSMNSFLFGIANASKAINCLFSFGSLVLTRT